MTVPKVFYFCEIWTCEQKLLIIEIDRYKKYFQARTIVYTVGPKIDTISIALTL